MNLAEPQRLFAVIPRLQGQRATRSPPSLLLPARQCLAAQRRLSREYEICIVSADIGHLLHRRALARARQPPGAGHMGGRLKVLVSTGFSRHAEVPSFAVRSLVDPRAWVPYRAVLRATLFRLVVIPVGAVHVVAEAWRGAYCGHAEVYGVCDGRVKVHRPRIPSRVASR